MIAIADRRDAWVELSSRPQRLTASLGWNPQTIQESEMALFYECMLSCAQRVLEIADIVYALGKFGRGGAEDEMVKLLIGIQRV